MSRFDIPEFQPPARLIDDFPPSFGRIVQAYDGFVPQFEVHRDSLGRWLGSRFARADVRSVEVSLTVRDGAHARPVPELLQRQFYWSATCFVRSFYLLLGYLALDQRALSTWADVTGYYSRLYGAKAICNLLLASWVFADVAPLDRPKDSNVLIYFSNDGVRVVADRNLRRARGSHDRWWTLFEQLRLATGLPDTQAIRSLFPERHFTQDKRQSLNYSDVYLEGFPELEWFDTDVQNMLAHAGWVAGRADQDFTDVNRYFAGYDSESVDVADYFTDPVISLWGGVVAYLELVHHLVPSQALITGEKLIALAERSLRESFPTCLAGMRTVFNELGI